jgi:hypothetical protein
MENGYVSCDMLLFSDSMLILKPGAVFADIETQNVDEVICLVTSSGMVPIQMSVLNHSKRCAISLLGNHDAAAVDILSTQHFNIHAKIAIEWTSDNLKKETRSIWKRFH